MRRVAGLSIIVALALAVSVTTIAQRGQTGTGRAQAPKTPASVERKAACFSSLGQSVKTQVFFCDVVVGPTGEESVSMVIPTHTGAATLFFDLHPRFDLPATDADVARAYQKRLAYIAVVGPTGDVIDRAAVRGEFRMLTDLFDRLPGPTAGTFKFVGPGLPAPQKVTIPANVSGAIGIVGLRVVVQNRFMEQAFADPGTPVAMVSNWRIVHSSLISE